MIKKKTVFSWIFLMAAVLLIAGCQPEIKNSDDSNKASQSVSYAGKKILFIDSYHAGYGWSDGITEGITNTLKDTGVELKIHRMDTKNNPAEDFKVQAGDLSKKVIEEFKPDVVIVADDNAFKYIVQKYYKDASLPFVYCGLNWDSSVYDAPYSNTVGMIEVALTPQALEKIAGYAKGTRIWYISGETETERKTMDYYNDLFKIKFEKEYWVKDFNDWKESYAKLQNEVDYVLFENSAGIPGFDVKEAKTWVLEKTKVPSVTTYDFVAPLTLMGLTKVPQEQGEWSANAALQILDGKKPSEMQEVKNKKGQLFINMQLADKLGVVFTPEILKNAQRLE